MSTEIRRQSPSWKAAGLAAVLAFGGILYDHGRRLGVLEYFDFFPVFLVAVIALTVRALQASESLKKRQWRAEPISLGLALLFYCGSIWAQSPWLGFASFFLLGNSLLVAEPTARSSWRLLILLIPLPMELDSRLIHELQRISSLYASRLLDFSGIPHLMRGNVLELPSNRFFVEEACSGIGSVYLLTAATALYVVLSQMRLIRGLPLLASVPWWAIVSNVVRIVVIAATAHLWQIDLSHGWQHETLGIAAMLLAFCGIWSTRFLSDFLFGPIIKAPPIKAIRLVDEGQHPDLTPVVLWELITMSDRSKVYTGERSGYTIDASRRKFSRALFFGLLIAGTAYWAVVYRDIFGQPTENTAALNHGADTRSVRPFAALNQASFENLQNIVVTDFRTETDGERISLGGELPRVWTSETQFGEAKLLLNGPFNSELNLPQTLKSEEWKIERTTVGKMNGQASGSHLLTIHATDPQNRRVRVHSCQLRPSGELLLVEDKNETSIVDQLENGFKQSAAIASEGTTWTLVLMTQVTGQSLDAEVRAEQLLLGDIVRELKIHLKHFSPRGPEAE